MKRGFKQSLVSLAIFGVVMVFLVSMDERVRERFDNLVTAGTHMSWGHRAGELGGAVVDAVRHQSIENAPLMLFAVVGGVLFLFMVRT